MGKNKVLLIDDEEDFCSLVKMHLEAIGDFSVDTATSGSEGLQLAEKTKPDVIVLDILMPEMDGLQVLSKLKQNRHTMEIPVIMLSGKDDESLKIKASELYDENYLTKPIDAKVLKTKIEEILKIRRGGS
ncbi:MAG: response regulator [Candidatus Omnitrophota bacterium]